MNTTAKNEKLGLMLGFLGVLGFSLTLPATRIAVAEMDATFVGLARALVAAIPALLAIIYFKEKIPERKYLARFALVALGVVIGFPLLSALAMKQLPASHGGVVVGLLPLATALAGAWRAGERPTNKFWLFAFLGSVIVGIFALSAGGGFLSWADLLLLGAIIAAAIGYAEGAVLSRTFGAWQVISWALLLSVPLLLPIIWWRGVPAIETISLNVWLAFLYVSLVSMFLAFIVWYKGLALGGIAHVGQVQLLQPFLTIFAAVLWLGEPLKLGTILCASGVLICVALGRRA
jgi:drug/metabolite transporter (DMT)-like permease